MFLFLRFFIGYSVEDLADEIETDAVLWQITPTPCTTCSLTYQTDINTCYTQSNLVLGGPDILTPGSTDMISFQRTYKNLSTHSHVVFSINISYFGSKTTVPTGQPILNLLFDGNTVAGPRIATADACSDSTNPTILLTNFQGAVAHTSSSLTLTIRTLFPFQQIQVGFRQVVLLLYTTAPSMFTADSPICQASITTNAFAYDECTCPLGKGYLSFFFATCQACYSPCSTCFLSGATNCYTCKAGYFWSGAQCAQSPPCCASYNGTYCSSCTSGCFYYGNGVCQAACDPDAGDDSIQVLSVSYCFQKCPDSSHFRYLNSSCLSSCPSPLTNLSSSANNLKYCYNPCSSSQYLYPDGSCDATCSTPLKQITIGDIPYCQSPCSDPSQFCSGATTSCLSSCPSPLVTTNVQGILYCSNPCIAPQYLYSNGSCLACPNPLTLSPGLIGTYCINPCSTTDTYLYPNKSCSNSCPSPLASRQEPGVKYCFDPCQSSQYLYSNGSCLSTCPAPLTSRLEAITTFCDNPCPIDDYLYWNGSCFQTCSSPLLSRQEPSVKYCFNPCQPSEYLYPNGSCFSDCSLPFASRNEPGVNYCSLICDGGYLLSNGSCISQCNSPFKKRTQQNTAVNYCDSPCSSPSDYYYPSDGSCQSQCEYPDQITNEDGLLQICTLMVTQAQVEQAKKLAQTTTTTNSISSGGIVAGSLLSSGDSTSAAMGSLTKMLSYIKFMDVKFPPKLQLLFDSSSSNSSLLSSIPNRLRDKTGNLPPPTNFKKYNVSSSFIVNFWQSLVILGIILMAIFILLIFSVFMKSYTAVSNILQKILSALKWNTFLTLFCSYCGDIVLFSALEFQTVQYNNFWSALSITLCILINVLMGYTLYKILTVNSSVRKIQQNKTSEEDIDKTFGDYKTLFECYKGDSYFQQIFMFVFMIRVSLFNGIIGYLYPHPLAQAILVILINTGILVYLVIKRPMRKIINLIQQILLEGIIFVFNIGVFILAILDAEDQKNETTRENIGDMLIMINVIVPILAMTLIAIKILLIIWEFYQNYKKSKAPANQKLPKISIQPTRNPSHLPQAASPGLQFREAVPINMSFTTDQTSHDLLRTKDDNNNNSLVSVESKLEHSYLILISL